ncbi:MAG: hypothetical protein KDD65_11175 [Bacteroidetes bacterium]|nr:hypothetical protein [Bacteroidota bacterium]
MFDAKSIVIENSAMVAISDVPPEEPEWFETALILAHQGELSTRMNVPGAAAFQVDVTSSKLQARVVYTVEPQSIRIHYVTRRHLEVPI